MLENVLDVALVVVVVVTALRAVHAQDLLTGVIVYIVFGLLMALVWVRLDAPDLAIAEAAIGAGLTGAMLLDAARQMGGSSAERLGPKPRGIAPAALAVIPFAAVLVVTFRTLAERIGPLAGRVAGELGASGVEHPITAVLLNFRGYDTWLEVGVLLVAGIATFALRRSRTAHLEPAPAHAPTVALGAAAILAPLGVLIAGYLLWRGSAGPGGAFQAGAVLAAVAVLLMLLGRPPMEGITGTRLTSILVFGFVVYMGVGVTGMLRGGAFLEYGEASAGLSILTIEAAVAISIGATLALLFAAGRGETTEDAPDSGDSVRVGSGASRGEGT